MRRVMLVLALVGGAVLAAALLSVRSAVSAPLRATSVSTNSLAFCSATTAVMTDPSNPDSTFSCDSSPVGAFAAGDALVCSVNVVGGAGHTIAMDWTLDGSPVSGGPARSATVGDHDVWWQYETQDPAITAGNWACRVKVDGKVVSQRQFTVASGQPHLSLVVYEPYLDSLDPALAYSTESWRVLMTTCAGLVGWKDGGPADAKTLFPDAATAMPTVSSDGLTYTFTVRSGMHFSSPSSQSVTPTSFVRAFQRAARVPGSPAGQFAGVIAGFDAYAKGTASSISGLTVTGSQLKIKLTSKQGNFLARLAMPFFCAVPTDTPLTAQTFVPSAGPYHIESGAPSTGAKLVFDSQYGGHRPHGAGTIYVVVGAAPRYGIEANAADAGFQFPAVSWPTILSQFGPSSAQKRAFAWPGAIVNQLTFNTGKPYLTAAVRKAIATGINRTALATTNNGVPTSSLLSTNEAGYSGTGPYALGANLSAARTLMASAGYSSSHHLALSLVTGLNSTYTARANALVTQLAAIYIDLTVTQVSNIYAAYAGTNWDIGTTGWQPDFSDPWDNLGPLFGTGGDANFSRYSSATFDAALASADAKTGSARASAFSTLATSLATGDVPATTYETFNDEGFFSTRIGCVTYGAFGLNLALLTDKNLGAACDTDARE